MNGSDTIFANATAVASRTQTHGFLLGAIFAFSACSYVTSAAITVVTLGRLYPRVALARRFSGLDARNELAISSYAYMTSSVFVGFSLLFMVVARVIAAGPPVDGELLGDSDLMLIFTLVAILQLMAHTYADLKLRSEVICVSLANEST